jgi:hypothetical protein
LGLAVVTGVLLGLSNFDSSSLILKRAFLKAEQADVIPADHVPVFSLFDSVGNHHKNGLLEVYGAELRHRSSGPLRISSTELAVTDDLAVVSWSPDYSPAGGAEYAMVSFASPPPERGEIALFVQTKTNQRFVFLATLGQPSAEISPRPLPSLIPDNWTKEYEQASIIDLDLINGNTYRALIPEALQSVIDRNPNGGLSRVGMWINRNGPGLISVRYAGLVVKSLAEGDESHHIGGQIKGRSITPGATVKLLLESGEVREQQVSTEGRFDFQGVPEGV